jgi:probable rRNA maturation factor
MILLDPDLDPDPALSATPAKRKAAPAVALKSSSFRLPSARTLARYLGMAQKAVRLKGQVTVLLTTDAAIRGLNRRFRGKNKATDVLSFPAEGVGAEGIAGDLVISVTTALGQAAEQGHSLSTEIKVLILHGLLHLAGYDHEADDGRMARRERLLRGKLGLPQGLIERAVATRPKAKKTAEKRPSGAKARIEIDGVTARPKSCPVTKPSRFFDRTGCASYKARADSAAPIAGVRTQAHKAKARADSVVPVAGVNAPDSQARSTEKGRRP